MPAPDDPIWPNNPHPVAVLLNDLYSFSPASATWKELSPSGAVPAPRTSMGFTATPDGSLYVFGGTTSGGEERMMVWLLVRENSRLTLRSIDAEDTKVKVKGYKGTDELVCCQVS